MRAKRKGDGCLKLYKSKSSNRALPVSILIFCAVLCLFWFGFSDTSEANSAKSLDVTRTAVQKAVINCYAIEGVYPPNIKYLEDHYGVAINHDKYIINYDLIGSNVMPSVEVLERGTE